MRESARAHEPGSLSGSVESLPCSSLEHASIFCESAPSVSMAFSNDFRKGHIVGSNGVREIARHSSSDSSAMCTNCACRGLKRAGRTGRMRRRGTTNAPSTPRDKIMLRPEPQSVSLSPAFCKVFSHLHYAQLLSPVIAVLSFFAMVISRSD